MEGLAAILRAEPTQLLLLPSQLSQLLLLPQCETLQRLIISGEQVSRFMVEQVCSKYPNLQLINLYGQTETTGDVLCAVLTEMDQSTAFHGDVVAVGKPIADSIILVNNQQELVIQGPQLSNGYLDKHGTTGNKFDSFATGDLGFCNDGIYYVKGRKDDVVKLHGIWTCPMEIETAFSRFYQIHHVLACFVNEEAYVLCPDESVCHRFSREDMHNEGNLPWNLIPKMAIHHHIPVNNNSGAGKVSRKDAKSIVEKYLEESSSAAAPIDDQKSKVDSSSRLTGIVCSVLNLDENHLCNLGATVPRPLPSCFICDKNFLRRTLGRRWTF
jgi:acyl-CoA synthetase (AMP-forming)/AMP-acid ligase II